MDEAMLSGCSAFGVASSVTFLVCVWPFLALEPLGAWKILLASSGITALGAVACTTFAARKAGLAGGVGSLAGTLAAGFCAFLRLDAIWRDAGLQYIQRPEFPPVAKWAAPALAIACSAITLYISVGIRSSTAATDLHSQPQNADN